MFRGFGFCEFVVIVFVECVRCIVLVSVLLHSVMWPSLLRPVRQSVVLVRTTRPCRLKLVEVAAVILQSVAMCSV